MNISEDKVNNKFILYIGRKSDAIDGGSVVSKRNIEFLQRLSNNKVLDFRLKDKTNYQKLFNIILGNPWGFSKSVLKRLISDINKFEISFVFIDHSLLGGYASILKKFNIPIIVFFHNIEFLYYKDKVIVDGFLNNLMVRFARKNEKIVTEYADKIICLTERDSNCLRSIYGRSADMLLPITMNDKYPDVEKNEHFGKYHLFVGSSFFANIDSISWYIENVLEFIDSNLVIIGNGMDILNKKYGSHPRVKIHGFVEDLSAYYINAEFVINPVRLGSGMKTKTVEALMYGKIVIGTEEAFVGLTNIYQQGIGYICNSSTEFINCINNFGGEKFNFYSRKYYLDNFSSEVGYKKLTEFLTANLIQ